MCTVLHRTLTPCTGSRIVNGSCCQPIRFSDDDSGARTSLAPFMQNFTRPIRCWELEFHLPESSGETRFESFIDTGQPAWLPDHQVMGNVVMPGAAFVEMAVSAGRNRVNYENVFEQPLRPTSRTALQTVVRTTENQHQPIEVFSSASDTFTWSRNFFAKMVRGTTEAGTGRSCQTSGCLLRSCRTERFLRKDATAGPELWAAISDH